MPRNTNTDWKSIFLEAFFVVLGVVLALAANGFREQRNNEHRAATALASMLEELTTNRESVTASIDYHSYLLDTLYRFTGVYGDDPGRYPSGRLFNRGFVNPARIVSRAWEAAANTGIIEFIPYDQVLLLSQVYQDQRTYESQGTVIGGQIYSRLFDQGIEGVLQNYTKLLTILSTFVYRECELAHAYAKVLPELDPASGKVEAPGFCQDLPVR